MVFLLIFYTFYARVFFSSVVDFFKENVNVFLNFFFFFFFFLKEFLNLVFSLIFRFLRDGFYYILGRAFGFLMNFFFLFHFVVILFLLKNKKKCFFFVASGVENHC